ncbi:unnamed protein product [Danaus chrysippus]|uniref:(African queen) hypothetical protein n=1 Tax=Danaus chrysippus TaxID=151541 RepID=A0A8J2MI47_9NEOP|nr:unnamed protein product [Danaus chrysippus]
MKSFGGLFMKVPQDVTKDETQDLLPENIVPRIADMRIGCTNQIARMLLPVRIPLELNDTKTSNNASLNSPIIDKTLENYKIIVAVAPKHIRIGKGDAKDLLVYIIFHDDEAADSSTIKMPSIYFVSKADVSRDLQRKEKADPIFVIDSNRTVTGLKSNEVSKFIKFRNKLRNHFKYM